MTLALIIVFTTLGSIVSVGLAGIFLFLGEEKLERATDRLIPYAIGTLLAAAFGGMIPEAQEGLGAEKALPVVMAGIFLFYMLEKFALWRHCHEKHCEQHHYAAPLILIGDSLHNFVDGVAIAVSFLTSAPLGIMTSVAIISHEVPQEVGDFAILLHGGYSRKKALIFNGLSSLVAFCGALLTFIFIGAAQFLVPYLMALSASSFIYIALADLVPGRRKGGGGLLPEVLLMGLGVATILGLHAVMPH